jgi:hypothetical protein
MDGERNILELSQSLLSMLVMMSISRGHKEIVAAYMRLQHSGSGQSFAD